jgi:hypothetical protein
MRSATGRGTAGILTLLTARCSERLRRRGLARPVCQKRAEAHAIRILLRRVGTRKTVAEILAR